MGSLPALKLFLSPHCDDEILFGAFTILRERPIVAIVFDSFIQPMRGYQRCEWKTRRAESLAAASVLGLPEENVRFVGCSDAERMPTIEQLRSGIEDFSDITEVYAPAIEEGGHLHHNFVGKMADELFPNVTHYMTYTNRGKSTGTLVPFEPRQAGLKLRALSCFESQIALKDNVDHFLRDQREYYQ